jgi:hypothetical protein
MDGQMVPQCPQERAPLLGASYCRSTASGSQRAYVCTVIPYTMSSGKGMHSTDNWQH